MFSKACEHAIKAIIYLINQSRKGHLVKTNEIAAATDVPPAFISKILQNLVRKDIVSSKKGINGGFFLTKSQIARVTLKDIVYNVDGEELYNSCGLGFKNCHELNPCPIHDQFAIIRKQLKHMLEQTKLVHLADNVNKGLVFLKVD